jgi:hypothetical protein
MTHEKTTYYKLFNGRNQLCLVTPVLSNIQDIISECVGEKIEKLHICETQRFYYGFRILKEKL